VIMFDTVAHTARVIQHVQGWIADSTRTCKATCPSKRTAVIVTSMYARKSALFRPVMIYAIAFVVL